VHERHRQTTDGPAIAYNERERELTFAKSTRSGTSYHGVRWPWSNFRMPLTVRAAAMMTRCSLSVMVFGDYGAREGTRRTSGLHRNTSTHQEMR